MFGKHVSEKMLRQDLGNEVEICYELLSSLASLLKLGLAIAWTAFIYCFLANKSFLPRCHGKIKTEKQFIILVLIRLTLVTKKQSNESKRLSEIKRRSLRRKHAVIVTHIYVLSVTVLTLWVAPPEMFSSWYTS